ncbi:primosomal protein [Vibrio cholerae]|nr:primosomal protein [Vibrio cholerae]
MKTEKEKKAYKQIVKILSSLNVYQAKNVLDSVYRSVSSGTLDLTPIPNNHKSKIDSDRELHDFILSLDLEFLTQKDVLLACIDKFGKERAPSRTSLNRAWKKLLHKKERVNANEQI